MKSPKYSLIIKSIAIIIILSIFSICLIGFFSTEDLQWRMFASIEEFQKLDQYSKEEFSIEKDKVLSGIIPESYYIKSILYDGNLYTVYAYVFSESKDALTYFNNFTGKKSESARDYSMSTNYLFSSDYIVKNENCVYRIEGGNYKNFVKAVNYINETFEIDATE